MSLKLLFYGLFFLGGYAHCENPPLVKTPLGDIKGYHKKSFNGRTYSAFEGIPYAKPPIGDLRFAEPQPVEPWHGTWNASFVTLCAQTVMTQTNATEGSEDCLHINVYVPRSQPDPSESLDVIFYIHGGAYMYGSGNSFSSPQLLMDRDIIFITFNYRLGILGFLSTEDDVVPGNNGLKDQSMALKWVKNNIASFGGNPESITLNGLSAGGSSVHLHYFSPLSKGLFVRGFAQSGSALNPWSIQENPLQKTKRLAEAVGCRTDNTKVLVQCLKERPVKQILSYLGLFFSFSFLPFAPFGPVVEKGGAQPFLSEDPYVLLKKGKINDVPLMASATTNEGFFPVMVFTDLDFIEQNWNSLMPSFLEFSDTLPLSKHSSVAQKIKKHYFGEKKVSNDTYFELMKVFTDRIFTTGSETAVQMHAKVGKSPVWYFFFGYLGDNNPRRIVSHGADAKYFFGPLPIISPSPLTPNELKMKDLMIDMLVEYARSGRASLGNVEWKPTGPGPLTYLKVNGYESSDISLETVEELSPVSFWDSLGFQEGENLLNTKDEL